VKKILHRLPEVTRINEETEQIDRSFNVLEDFYKLVDQGLDNQLPLFKVMQSKAVD
jgi:hypothetical protein